MTGRTFGAFSAFIVALFVEMYGFPLTIYLLSGSLTRRFPGVDPLGYDFGHLWYTLLGFENDPHLNPIHIASNLAIFGGFILLSGAWRVLFQAQREGKLITNRSQIPPDAVPSRRTGTRASAARANPTGSSRTSTRPDRG